MLTSGVGVAEDATEMIRGLIRVELILVVAIMVVPVMAAAVVPPMAGGDARYVLKPAPLIVLDADKVVKAPVLVVVAPTVPLRAPAKLVLAVIVVPVMAAAAVPPIAGGEAKYEVKPAPLTVLDADKVVKAPVLAVEAPTVVALMDPPVMTTAPAPCVDIVPRPLISVFGIVADAVMAVVPVPLTYPVRVVAPVPPLLTTSVPARVIAPAVAVLGVKPVVPALNVVTPAVPLAIRVMAPDVLLMVMPDPAVRVLRVKPVPLPIKS